MLCLVADRLLRCVPSDATVARLGGDEYAVVLEAQDDATAESVVSLVRHTFAVPFELDELRVTVEASVGVARSSEGVEPRDVLRHADIAMYAAKDRRTGVEAYRRELEVVSPARLTLLTDLKDGITHGQLAIHVQPKVHLHLSIDDQTASSLAIVAAIVDLGHRLGRRVVAEGVEDESTWQLLQQLGCDSAQGYWMGRPMPAADFLPWLEQWRPLQVAGLRALA